MKHTQLPLIEFTQRRERFFAYMQPNSIAFFSSNDEMTRSNDTEFPFCQNKNFYYLTGFNEPEAILCLVKTENTTQSILFSRAKDPLMEVWHGIRVGQEAAVSLYGFEHCFSINDIDEHVPDLLNGKSAVYSCISATPALDKRISHWQSKVASTIRQGGVAPLNFIDCAPQIHDMRLFKSDAELTIMRQANHLSGLAHQRAMQASEVGKYEYQIEADILHEFATHGARFPAYNSIVAGGNNANILHYTDNHDTLKDNDLLLIDAGGELAGYAADITRTFPVNGRFTSPQKALYQLVLDVQNTCISAIKPNATLAELNTLANEVFTIGLVKLGLLQGDVKELINGKASKKYFIHGLGHWLGLDVHDVGDYHSNEKREQLRPFEAGMVMTIEPGLYIPSDDVDVDKQWRGIGIRIEDNILVTPTGHENLTINAPKTISDIEQLMQR